MQFLPKHHMISMEERFAWASALSTTYLWDSMCSRHVDWYSRIMWFNTQWMVDWYSRIDDMNSTNAHAILAQTPYVFNGGEICTSISTQHNILVRQYVQLIFNKWQQMADRYSMTNDQWNDKCRCLINSGPNTIWFLWRRELIQRRHSAQHTCAWDSIWIDTQRTADQYSMDMLIDTQGSMIWTVLSLSQQSTKLALVPTVTTTTTSNNITACRLLSEDYFFCTAALFLLHHSTNECTLLSL
jgi:hypothetical protein